VFPNLNLHSLHAVIVLAEELNFTRAADRLRISQPALSKKIRELEKEEQLHLFTRAKGRVVELTDAGRTFVEEARVALQYAERAVHLARATHDGSDSVLAIGHSPYANHDWISTMLTIRLPLYPRLRIRLVTQFAMESIQSVLAGEVDLALVTAPPPNDHLTSVPFAAAPLYVALHETHPSAHKERLTLQDLAKDEWILFAKRVHPPVHEAILEAARRESIVPKHDHEIITAQQAVDLVWERVGVAILTEPMARSLHIDGVVVKAISESSLRFEPL
jgi:DNA-binding transcriptional LysR family regulator